MIRSLILLLVLLSLQVWYSRTPPISGRALLVETSPKGVEVYTAAPELRLSKDATTSGGTAERFLGITPNQLNLYQEELPQTLVFRKAGFETVERHFTSDSFVENRCPRVVELAPENVWSSVKQFFIDFPFLCSSVLVLLWMGVHRRGAVRDSRIRREQQEQVRRGVVLPGTMIAQYKVVEKIGSGGMAQVFRVAKVGVVEPLALKLLDATGGQFGEMESFRAEVKATASISHPGLLYLYDWGAYAGRPYMVTELLEGVTLKDQLKQRTFSEKETIELALKLSDILSVVHRSQMVHRDVKPSNIFLTEDNRVKLMDFGIAAAMSETEHKGGTLGYAPPEQLAGKPVTAQTDIYSLGATLVECLQGQPLFVASSVLQAQESQESLNLEDRKLPISESFLNLLTSMLAPEPAGRPKDMNEVASVLKECASDP